MLGLLHAAIGIFIMALIGFSFAVAGVMRIFGCERTILSGIIGSVLGVVVLFIAGLSEGAIIASVIVTVIATVGGNLWLTYKVTPKAEEVSDKIWDKIDAKTQTAFDKSDNKSFQKAFYSPDKDERVKYIGRLMVSKMFQFAADIPPEETYDAICRRIDASADIKAITARMEHKMGSTEDGINAINFIWTDATIALLVERIPETTHIVFGIVNSHYSSGTLKESLAYQKNDALLIETLRGIIVSVLEAHCPGNYSTTIIPADYWRS